MAAEPAADPKDHAFSSVWSLLKLLSVKPVGTVASRKNLQTAASKRFCTPRDLDPHGHRDVP
jgi:hypothetical protein